MKKIIINGQIWVKIPERDYFSPKYPVQKPVISRGKLTVFVPEKHIKK